MARRIGVVGGGITGVALARALAQGLGAKVTVLEKEARLAAHQTGHNSGVVHAGVYYEPGSLKAILCARGREMTRDFCIDHALPYRELGKLVIASNQREVAALDLIEQRARANGVPELRRLRAEEIGDIEPHAVGLSALHSPHTAVVDYRAITEALAEDATQHGATILTNREVHAIRQASGTVTVSASDEDFEFDSLVVCAGLQSDTLAVMAGADPSPRILPFRGEYRDLVPERRDLVRGMIYPVPDPRFPFLGIHFTRSVTDEVRVGPNAVPALAREGYRWRTVSIRDTVGALRWPGAPALARQHWRMGVHELAGSLLKPRYVREARRFVPELRSHDLTARSRSGVRAQAWSRDGTLVDDFQIDTVGAVTLLRNAPSPAATSAMAIAEHLIDNRLLAI